MSTITNTLHSLIITGLTALTVLTVVVPLVG